MDKGSGPHTTEIHSPTIPSGALQLWQKHWSTESRTRPISMLRSFRFVQRGLSYKFRKRISGDDANDRSSTLRPRHWEKLEGWKRRRRDQDRKEWVRHTGSVAQVVTGAVAGGRLARTLRRDARRRSISRPPFSSSSSPPDPPSLRPRHATNSLPGDKPPFQLATPTCDRHYC